VFDNTKISDHFAIIPTLQSPKHLNEAEQKLYDFVVRRFLAVFLDPPLNLGVRHGEHALHRLLEPRKGFRSFEHLRMGLHRLMIARSNDQVAD